MIRLDKYFQEAIRNFFKGKAVSPRQAALWNRCLDPANTDRDLEEVAAEFEREWPDPYAFKGDNSSTHSDDEDAG